MINFQAKKLPVRKRPVYNPFEEPGRILKTAGEQVGGALPEQRVEQALPAVDSTPPEEIVEAKARGRLRELRSEIQKVRERERQDVRRKTQGEVVARQQEQQKTQTQPILEPQGRRPRGILAGMSGLVKRLQRKVEAPRGPTQ